MILEDLQKEFPNIKTRAIEADFGKMSTMQEYKKLVMFNLTDIDIGMLIINAGCVDFKPFS